ncbi:MAG: glycosyltransferase [Oscillospiraceae bacterium]|nr:glycosyltransferase [Oscillospiraceae bacterium]
METGKPLISILMAVYNPRLDWLREQLESLETQTYPNLRLYIRDDCSPAVALDEIEDCVRACIQSFPYEIKRNERNLGSNLTFEQLTQEAEGTYFAYCDQDDIWLPEKLEVLQTELVNSGARLVCSDMYIIDGNGRQVADSITKIRRHHKFRSGSGLTDTLWYSNFASGCALLVRAETAKSAVPFNPYMYYDHYITLFAANEGIVVSMDRPLIRHREHGENQSSTMQGVVDRESYIRLRVDTVVEAVRWLSVSFPAPEELKGILDVGLIWMEARQKYLQGDRSRAGIIWNYRRFSPMASLFELMMPFLPDCLFKLALWASKHNYI